MRDELEAPSDAVISSFFSTMIELVSFDDEKTGLSGWPALVKGNGMSLSEHDIFHITIYNTLLNNRPAA